MAKIILTQEVGGLGTPGDIVDVADGYARNFLLPRKMAIVHTRGAEKQVGDIRRAREVREVRDLGQARELAAQLRALSVRLQVRAGAGGRLFGSVTPADIVEAVRSAGGPLLDRRRLELGPPIKTVGTHVVRVRLHPDVTADLAVEVAG